MLGPYLSFTGNCEEALKFYAEAFGGEVEYLLRYSDAPPEAYPNMPESEKHKVMHAQVRLTETGILSGADADWDVQKGNSVSIHAYISTEKQAREIYEKLSEGASMVTGIVSNPPPDDDGLSGMVTDRYGFSWVISAYKGS